MPKSKSKVLKVCYKELCDKLDSFLIKPIELKKTQPKLEEPSIVLIDVNIDND